MFDNATSDALIGSFFVLTGLTLLVFMVIFVRRNRSHLENASYLAPTRAAQALNPELQLLYQKTRLFELEAESRFPGTAGTFARELRRGIFQAQANLCLDPDDLAAKALVSAIDAILDAEDLVPERIAELKTQRLST